MYTIYKICYKDETITDCYVGRTSNFEQRKIRHKSNCNNNNGEHYNVGLYQFIRDHNGFENWIFEVLETCDELTKSKELERKWFENIKPTLNYQIPMRTRKEKYICYSNTKYICECGGKTSLHNKHIHNKTKKHLDYLQKL